MSLITLGFNTGKNFEKLFFYINEHKKSFTIKKIKKSFNPKPKKLYFTIRKRDENS